MSGDMGECSILKGILQNGSAYNYPAVRFGRVPKREKAKILAAMQSSRMKTQESKVLTEMSDDGKIIETIVRAHYDTCDYTRNKMEPFIQKAKASPAYAVCSGATCPMKGRPEDSFLDHFSERFMDHVRQVCNFAKLVPGFKCLHHDDQVTLLKSCVFEVLLVRLSGLFDNKGLICLNGDIIRKDTINQMPPGNARFLMDSVFELAQRLNQFRLSDAEIGLFCAVVIITADRPGLRNPELVQKMQNKLKGVLSSILLPQHPEHASIFSELMTMIHDLRTLNTLHTEKFLQQCKVNNAQITAAAEKKASPPPTTLQQHLLYGAPLHPASWASQQVAQQQQQHHQAQQAQQGGHHDRDGSTGNASPHSSDTHSSTSTEDQLSSRRSPIGSVSSSESICSTEISRLTVQDLRVNNSVLMNALTIPAMAAAAAAAANKAASQASATASRKRSIAEEREAREENGVNSTASSSSASAANGGKFKVRKLDSPSDSGIDSPKAGQGSSNSTNTSVCSSPRSSSMDDEKKEASSDDEAKQTVGKAPTKEEMHPLLKRALQQPPQPYNNLTTASVSTFKDEVYKPHKKFRRMALSTGDDCPSSSTTERVSSPPSSCPMAAHSGSGSSGTSLLVSQLSEPPLHRAAAPQAAHHSSLLASTLRRATPMAQEESKRNEILANLILNPSGSSSYHRASKQAEGLLMCASSLPSSSMSTSTSTTTAAAAATSRHLPVQAAPTKPCTSTQAAAAASTSSESKMSQLAAAASATLAAESSSAAAQPLNLSKAKETSTNHDIPTEA